jgi:hypothetical protein
MNRQSLYSNELKIKTNWVVVLLLMPWLLFDIAGLSFIGYGLIFHADRVGDMWLIWIFFFVAGIFALNIVVWNLRGKEIISVTEKGITLKKIGNLFSTTNNIEFNELESVNYDKDDETPWWRKFWRTGGGKIIVRYLGTQRRIGQNLDLKTAEQITIDIRSAIEKLSVDN